jgi:hypothetical protein
MLTSTYPRHIPQVQPTLREDTPDQPRTRRYNLTLKNQVFTRLNRTWQDSPVRRETEVLEAKVGIEPAYTALQAAA